MNLRAVGGNVLLVKVASDEHTGLIYGLAGASNQVMQIGEVVGLGGRWTQGGPWQPPIPVVRRTTLDNGGWDKDWRPPDLSHAPRRQPAVFGEAHLASLDTVKVGSLVVFTQSRAYDVFRWEGRDIIVFPGQWLHGVLEGVPIAERPELRRYMLDTFDTAAPEKPVVRDARVGRGR